MADDIDIVTFHPDVTMPELDMTFIWRRQAMADATMIAHINHNAEVQKILADAKKILSFYEKGPIE